MSKGKLVIPLFSLFHYSVLFTVHSRRPKKSLAATLTLQTLKQMLMTKVRRRKKTRMKRVGTGPRSRQRGGKGGRASLRFTSPVSWKVVTWRTKITRSALRTCPRGSRCVCLSVFSFWTGNGWDQRHWCFLLACQSVQEQLRGISSNRTKMSTLTEGWMRKTSSLSLQNAWFWRIYIPLCNWSAC